VASAARLPWFLQLVEAQMRYIPPVALVLAVGLCSCTQPIRTSEIIEKYIRAECVPVRFGPDITPPTRAWDHSLKLRDGAMGLRERILEPRS